MHVATEESSVGARVGSGIGHLESPIDMFVAVNGSVKRLSHLRRYSSFRAIWSENVAEHSFYCAFYAWLVASDLVTRGYDVDPDAACAMAVFADLEEALTGDLLTIFKNSSPELKAESKRMAGHCAQAMFTEYGALEPRVTNVWQASSEDSLEARVVKFADLLCVVAYAREEVAAGNDAFRPVLRDIHRDMRSYLDENEFDTYIYQIWPTNSWNDVLREVQGVHNSDNYPKLAKGDR